MLTNSFRDAIEGSLMVALVLGMGTFAQAQNDQQGPVIQIGKADAEVPEPSFRPQATDGAIVSQPEMPKHWIGLLGGPIGEDHPLRYHINIPDNQGLLVAEVVPDSPAAKAGLKKYDVLLRANDIELRAMEDLVELVRIEGEKQGQITIDVLRQGQIETLYVAPAERPADAPRPQGGGLGGAFEPGFGMPGGVELPRELLREFRNNPLEFRQFGPGVIVGGGRAGVANLPNGVSVSISKENDQPARITVNRGGETWEVVGDDPESLNQLPEDLRPFIEQMLQGNELGRMNLRGTLRSELPELGDGRLRERLERMERRMQELQERLLGSESSQSENNAQQ